MLRGRRVGGENRRTPAAAVPHQPVTDPPKESAGSGQRQPLAVRRIHHDEPRLRRRPHLLEVPLRDLHHAPDARRRGAGLRRLHRPRIEVARHERADRSADTRLQFRHQPPDQVAVPIAEPAEAVRLPPRPPQARRHARGDRRRLDDERARAAERVEHRLAGRAGIGTPRPPPAGDRQDPRRQHLGERRLNLAHPPAALVERAAGRVAEDRRHAPHEVQGQPQRRPAELHARSPARRRPQLVDDRILHDLRGVQRMRRECVVDRRIDAERVGDLQLLRPVHLLHRPVELLG